MDNWRGERRILNCTAYLLTVADVWIEKGMGPVIPSYVPTPTGEILEYMPNSTEIAITVGV